MCDTDADRNAHGHLDGYPQHEYADLDAGSWHEHADRNANGYLDGYSQHEYADYDADLDAWAEYADQNADHDAGAGGNLDGNPYVDPSANSNTHAD